MAEINNRKRKLSSTENSTSWEENARKHGKNDENDLPFDVQADSDSNKPPDKNEDSQFLSKSALMSFSRIVSRNLVGTIGRKTALIAKRTLRSGRGSLQNLNRDNDWGPIKTLSPHLEGSQNNPPMEEPKRKQILQKYSTLKLRKLQDKFKTRRQLRKHQFRSLQTISQDRFRKDLNQSRRESNKQAKLLDKLLEKHNKYLENL